MPDRSSLLPLLSPRYWPTWVGIAIIRLLAFLPLPAQHAIGTGLGLMLWKLFPSRRRIAAINVGLCLPELSTTEREALVRRHFVEVARSVVSTGVNWFASGRRLEHLIRIEGEENLRRVLDAGDGVILLAPHFIALEIGGIFLSRRYPVVSMYQYAKNRLVDRLVRRGRSRFGSKLVERKEPMRQLVREIRSGKLFYYLPDQDPGPKKGIFVPFFGIPTATYPMLSRFARMGRARVLPCLTEQLPGGRGWRVRILPALADFPSDDEAADAAAMNRAIEDGVRDMPAQYFWVHKRFKTRPDGAPPVY